MVKLRSDHSTYPLRDDVNIHAAICYTCNSLITLRVVGTKEAEKCVLKYPGCSYEECSAAAQDDNVEVVFRSFIKKVCT